MNTVGIPVIAVGVPLVVELTSYLGSIAGREDCHELEKVMDELPKDLMITPKSIDDTVESSAEMIGHALNIALGVDSLYN